MTVTDAGQRNSVTRVSSCTLRTVDWQWSFAGENATEISEHWAKRSAQSSAFFNGRIYMLRDYALDSAFSGALFETDFANFLYWREHGFPDRSVYDGFGSALLRSADSDIILGKQRSGNINAGLAYLPGGFIDVRDRQANGSIDIAASILREVTEETGLTSDVLVCEPGFIITRCGQLVSIAAEFRSSLNTHQMLKVIAAHISNEDGGELEKAIAITSRQDTEALAMPPYARVLLDQLLGQPGQIASAK